MTRWNLLRDASTGIRPHIPDFLVLAVEIPIMSNKDQFDIGMPPPGGDKNYGGALIGINWAVFAPANIFVALRIYTRLKISHNLGWDDGMIVLAQVRPASECFISDKKIG